jgi:Plavaka transposase
VSFKTGVPGTYLFLIQPITTFSFFKKKRCTALPTDIDGAAGPRTNALMDTLLATFDTNTLREEYGIDAPVVPFTRDFPQADIYELISSDLLHQAIKGCFKDHLVAWVGEYLETVYDTAQANKILDEIDRR